MKAKKSRYEAVKEYRRSKVKRIPLDIPAMLYAEFKETADASGEKINTILRRAIENYIEEHGNENGVQPIEQNGDLVALAQNIKSNQRNFANYEPQTYNQLPPDYEPKSWEKALPKKYWGFNSYSELSEFIKTNDLNEQFYRDVENV